jgi:hypothetical protein
MTEHSQVQNSQARATHSSSIRGLLTATELPGIPLTGILAEAAAERIGLC